MEERRILGIFGGYEELFVDSGLLFNFISILGQYLFEHIEIQFSFLDDRIPLNASLIHPPSIILKDIRLLLWSQLIVNILPEKLIYQILLLYATIESRQLIILHLLLLDQIVILEE